MFQKCRLCFIGKSLKITNTVNKTPYTVFSFHGSSYFVRLGVTFFKWWISDFATKLWIIALSDRSAIYMLLLPSITSLWLLSTAYKALTWQEWTPSLSGLAEGHEQVVVTAPLPLWSHIQKLAANHTHTLVPDEPQYSQGRSRLPLWSQVYTAPLQPTSHTSSHGLGKILGS